jgi:antitoxin component YwqK of YwqJK toxin-antitoxin module
VQYLKQRKGKLAMVKHYNNGQIAETGWYKSTLPHGAWARFNKDGQITTQAAFIKGLKHGTWKFWDHDGKLLCEIEYHYGQLITARQYNINGNIIAAIGGR